MDIDPETNTPESLERKKQDQRLMNAVLALIFFALLSNHLWQFYQFRQINTLLYIVQISITILFFLIRDFPKKTSLKPYDWTIAIVATWLPLLLKPGSAGDSILFWPLQLVGLTIAILGYLSLNKSIGIVPALRTLKTDGVYRFVRHPVYGGYFLAYTAYCAQNPTLSNILIVMAVITLGILRIISEEEFLSRSPDYLAYAQKVRWRVLPGIW